MLGVDAENGKNLDALEHLQQSIRDILNTRIGTRVMLREYGSNIPNLIDAPINRKLFPKIFAATAEALDKWEPRLRLTQVNVLEVTANGQLTLSLQGLYKGVPVNLTTEVLKF